MKDKWYSIRFQLNSSEWEKMNLHRGVTKISIANMMKRIALDKDLTLLHWDHTMDEVMQELIAIRKKLPAEECHPSTLEQILSIMQKLEAKWLQ